MQKRIATVLTFLVGLLAPAIAFAAPAAEGAAPSNPLTTAVLGFSMAFAIGLAALGGALGQGRAVSAALEGICRNPNSRDAVFVPMILGLSFIESLVIFGLVISFILNTK